MGGDIYPDTGGKYLAVSALWRVLIFSARFEAPSLLHLSADTPSLKSKQDLPRSLYNFHCMPSSIDPGDAIDPCLVSVSIVLHSCLITRSAISKSALTRLNHFSLTVCGLQCFCLRLVRRVTSDVPKTRYIMCLVNTSMVVLSTTSYTALRGARWDSPGPCEAVS